MANTTIEFCLNRPKQRSLLSGRGFIIKGFSSGEAHLVGAFNVVEEGHEGGDVYLSMKVLQCLGAPSLEAVGWLLLISEDGRHLGILLGLFVLRTVGLHSPQRVKRV